MKKPFIVVIFREQYVVPHPPSGRLRQYGLRTIIGDYASGAKTKEDALRRARAKAAEFGYTLEPYTQD